MHSRWPELLAQLFTLRSDALRETLQAWPAPEREALFKAHKKDLQALRQSCFYRPPRPGEENSADYHYLKPRYPRIASLYTELQPHLGALADWLKAQQLSVWLAEDVYTLFLNLDTCWALLCDARSATQLCKRLNDAPHARHEAVWHERGQHMTRRADAPEPWLYSLTQALLWRAADWADALLRQLFNQCNQHAEGGFYLAVCDVVQRRPMALSAGDASAGGADFLGKALNLELWIYREQLHALPEAHFEALLSWIAPDTPELRHLEALDYEEIRQRALTLAQQPAWRTRLLVLILQRLQAHTRPARNLPWLKLWQALDPQPTELLLHENTLLSLAHAPQSNALQLGLQVLKAWLKAGQSLQQPEAWRSMLLHHLQHPVQKVAKESLALLKQWLKQYPEHEAPILDGLSQQLLTPHTAVREQLYAWLQKQPLSAAAAAHLALLASDPALPPLERENLLQRFPHLAAAATETLPVAAPPPLSASDATPPDALTALPLWQQPWAEALLAALAGAAELQSRQPELASLRLAESLPVPLDTQTLLEGFLSQASGPVSPLQLECLMQAVLKLPAPVDRTRAVQYLDPLLKLLPRMDQVQTQMLWRAPSQNALVALLAWGWLEAGQMYPFRQATSQETLLCPNLNPQAGKVLATLQALRAGAPARLSQPDSLSGWMAPESLLQRLKTLPPDCITADELEQTLYALVPFPLVDWPLLEPLLQALPLTFQRALRVACAPEAQAEAAAADWLKAFASSPPQDVFLSASWDRPVFDSQPVDRDFQLLAAALAARQNHPDYKPWPVLQALPLQQLRVDLGIDYGQIDALMGSMGEWNALNEALEDPEALADNALQELLNAFQTQSEALVTRMPTARQRKLMLLHEMSAGFQALVQQALVDPQPLQAPLSPRLMAEHPMAFQLQLQHYRNLYPYLLNLQNTPQWQPLPAMPRHWSELTPWLWPHPGQVQRLFLAALINVGEAWGQFGGLTWQAYNQIMNAYYRQKAEDPGTPEPTVNWQEIVPRLDKNDLSLAFLALGQLPEIPLAEVLPLLIQPLTSKHAEQRAVVLGVLQAGLADGRLLPQQLAEVLAGLLGVTRKGFRYLQLVLQDLQHQDAFGEYLVLQTLELYFARLGAEQIKAASVLSALLDQAHSLCQTLQRGLERPAARAALQSLAESKKKSVSRDKARLLLALPATDGETLTRRLLQSLLQRLVQGA